MAAKAPPKMTSIEKCLEEYEDSQRYLEISLWDIKCDPVYLQWIKEEFEDSPMYPSNNGFESKDYLVLNQPIPPNDVLDKILFKYGLDIENNIDYQVVIHRTFSGLKVYGPRWVGNQRTDKEWLEFKKKYGV